MIDMVPRSPALLTSLHARAHSFSAMMGRASSRWINSYGVFPELAVPVDHRVTSHLAFKVSCRDQIVARPCQMTSQEFCHMAQVGHREGRGVAGASGWTSPPTVRIRGFSHPFRIPAITLELWSSMPLARTLPMARGFPPMA